MDSKVDLTKYVCRAPFEDFMIFHNSTWFCCPDWMEIPFEEWSFLKEGDTEDLKSVWFNEINTKVREGVLDGTYKYCSKTKCPYLSKLINTDERTLLKQFESNSGQSVYFGYFYKRKEFFKKYNLSEKDKDWKLFPRLIYFNFDFACNLRCPSCRLDTIPNRKDKLVDSIIDDINNQFSENVEVIHMTGSGDPFYSNAFRTFMQNFDAKRYPKLKSIYLVSNGNMWTQEMWESVKAIHPYVYEYEISIDAATKGTYENKVRLNGHWDTLMKNLKYHSTLKFINRNFSFVVQDHNVREINKFVKLIESIYDYNETPYTITFRAIQDWNHQTKEWVKERAVQEPSHPLHNVLLEQLKELGNKKYVIHNFWHLISEEQKTNEIFDEPKKQKLI
jgi:organic radical activating enzyme